MQINTMTTMFNACVVLCLFCSVVAVVVVDVVELLVEELFKIIIKFFFFDLIFFARLRQGVNFQRRISGGCDVGRKVVNHHRF
jgi:hypothetical protein